MNSIRCSSCGKPLQGVHGIDRSDGDILIGEIRIDVGEPASNSGPEIAPEYYFWCAECTKTHAKCTGKHALTKEQRAALEYAISTLDQCGSEPEDLVVTKILQKMLDQSRTSWEITNDRKVAVKIGAALCRRGWRDEEEARDVLRAMLAEAEGKL